MTFALLAYIIAQIADILTTNAALKEGGREANPIVARLMGTFGKRWWVAKIVVAFACAAVMVHAGSVVGLWVVAAITGAIAYRNTTVT